MIERQVAVGGQFADDPRPRPASITEIFLPLFGEYQAQNAACALAAVGSVLFGAGAEQSGPLDLAPRCGRRSRPSRSPGRLERVRSSPRPCWSTRPTTRTAWRPRIAALDDAFDFRQTGRCASPCWPARTPWAMLELLEPAVEEIVVTENNVGPRSLPADDLAAIAVDIVRAWIGSPSNPRLDDAIDAGDHGWPRKTDRRPCSPGPVSWSPALSSLPARPGHLLGW